MTASIDEQFVEYIVKSLVGKPDAVSIQRTIDEKGVLLELTVDPEDLGRVIGKRGATAQSLRTLLRALGTKNDARYNLKIVDNGEPRPPREDYHRDGGSPKDDSAQNDSGQATDEPSAAPAVDEPADTAANEPDKSEAEPEAKEEANQTTGDDAEHSEETGSNLAERTRRELAELDDLDV